MILIRSIRKYTTRILTTTNSTGKIRIFFAVAVALDRFKPSCNRFRLILKQLNVIISYLNAYYTQIFECDCIDVFSEIPQDLSLQPYCELSSRIKAYQIKNSCLERLN